MLSSERTRHIQEIPGPILRAQKVSASGQEVEDDEDSVGSRVWGGTKANHEDEEETHQMWEDLNRIHHDPDQMCRSNMSNVQLESGDRMESAAECAERIPCWNREIPSVNLYVSF